MTRGVRSVTEVERHGLIVIRRDSGLCLRPDYLQISEDARWILSANSKPFRFPSTCLIARWDEDQIRTIAWPFLWSVGRYISNGKSEPIYRSRPISASYHKRKVAFKTDNYKIFQSYLGSSSNPDNWFFRQ